MPTLTITTPTRQKLDKIIKQKLQSESLVVSAPAVIDMLATRYLQQLESEL